MQRAVHHYSLNTDHALADVESPDLLALQYSLVAFLRVDILHEVNLVAVLQVEVLGRDVSDELDGLVELLELLIQQYPHIKLVFKKEEYH